MWELPATEIRELDIQRQHSNKKCAENIKIEFDLHDRNGKYSITMKVKIWRFWMIIIKLLVT